MHGRYIYIYHEQKNQPNVGSIYIPYMDPMGNVLNRTTNHRFVVVGIDSPTGPHRQGLPLGETTAFGTGTADLRVSCVRGKEKSPTNDRCDMMWTWSHGT